MFSASVDTSREVYKLTYTKLLGRPTGRQSVQ